MFLDVISRKVLAGLLVAFCVSTIPVVCLADGDDDDAENEGWMWRRIQEGARGVGEAVDNMVHEKERRRERLQDEAQRLREQARSASSTAVENDLLEQARIKQAQADEITSVIERQRVMGEDIAAGWLKGVGGAFIQNIESSTRRAEEAEKQAMKNRGALQRLKEFSKWENLRNYGLATSGVLFAASGAYFGGKFAYQYAEMVMGTPELTSYTNIPSGWERIFGGKKMEASRMKEFVPPPGIDEEIKRLANTIQSKIANGRMLSNVLFYGPPGTGKTLFAKELAKKANAYCDVIAGANFSQFAEGDDVTKLNQWFDSREYVAQRDGKPVIVFIDEADAFLIDRRHPSATDRTKKLVNTFLSRVEKPSSKHVMFIFATNHPEVLDRAVWSRIGAKIEFKLPALEQRKQLIVVYLNKHVIEMGISLDDSKGDLEKAIIGFAPRIDGFSARGIEQMMVDFQTAVDEEGTNMLTLELVEKVVAKKIAEHKLAVQLEKQKQEKLGLHGFVGETGALGMAAPAA